MTERQNGTLAEARYYLGGFEVYREFDGTGTNVTLERQTLHVTDDKRRIALVDTRTQGDDGSPIQLVRYQFSNHLGSASLELDQSGGLISYEEYSPYGNTAFQAGTSAAELSLKRYRYTGMERDAENGFTYHGARYYAPWLARWISCDGAGLAHGLNLYEYCRGNPMVFTDMNGRDPVSIGQAGDLKDTATLDDLKAYASAHGQTYSDPENKRGYVMTSKGGQWQGGTLAPKVYDPDADHPTGFGDVPKDLNFDFDKGTIPSGPYATSPGPGPMTSTQNAGTGGTGSSHGIVDGLGLGWLPDVVEEIFLFVTLVTAFYSGIGFALNFSALFLRELRSSPPRILGSRPW